MRRLAALLVVVTSLALGACGGSSTSPSSVRTPAYGGTWPGTYVINNCAQTGQIATLDLCTDPITNGTLLPFEFHFTQNGTSVSGQFSLGTAVFVVPATTIAADGSLTLAVTRTEGTLNELATWSLHLPFGTTTMTGTLANVWTSTGLTGQLSFGGNIVTVARTATIAVTASDERVAPKSMRDALKSIQ